MKKYGVWAIVLIALLLFAGCSAKPEGTEPTEFRVACFECKEMFTAGQLNTDFGLCQGCMVKVGASYCQECSAPCYIRDMIHGLCTTCNAASKENTVESETITEPETTVEPENTVAVDMVNCNLCGRPIASSEAKGGYCPGCYIQSNYHEDERNFATCDYCGVTYGYSDPLVGGACQSCWNGFAGLCKTCGRPYRDGDGFESLCYSCQDKYGPKCRVCGDDLTYQGGVDGLCYACYDAANSCKECGADLTYQNYDGYCYYCHPSFGHICSNCGQYMPYHRPDDGICSFCKCSKCGAILAPGDEDGLCDDCYEEPEICPSCNVYTVYKDGLCYWCQPETEFICSICGESKLCPIPNSNVCYDCGG